MSSFSCRLLIGVLFAVISLKLCAAQCNTNGWFGSGCKYMCHCAGSDVCDRTSGSCPGACDPDWFGPACQYEVSRFTVIGSGLSWLGDDDDGTCNNGVVQSISMTLNTPHPLTWVRLVVSNAVDPSQFTLEYRVSSGAVQTCSDARSARVNNRTVDISCPTSESASHVTLTGWGVRSLCSVYISGGRNVALKQAATQINTAYGFAANRAVDGNPGEINPNPGTLGNTCTHTISTTSTVWWALNLSRRVELNRVVIYNRRDPARSDCCEQRLIGFTLNAFSSTSSPNRFWGYTDPGPTAQDVYTVVPSPKLTQDVHRISIYKGPDSRILTLCEVLIFGETACNSGTFGRECERDCNCVGGEACFVSTGGCPSGCATGYTGEDCYTQCPDGRYGNGCSQTCSPYCRELPGNSYCDHETGACDQGCDPGYRGSKCDERCPPGSYDDCMKQCSVHCAGPSDACYFVDGVCDEGCDPGYVGQLCLDECPVGEYGDRCAETCSSTCAGPQDACHHETGVCDQGCDPGYRGDMCENECGEKTFGQDCQQSCSTMCLDQLCHHETGVCTQCPPGYTGDQCDQECPVGIYGPGCQEACSSYCAGPTNDCNHVNGSCVLGCVPGYRDSLCVRECAAKTYGQDCKEDCNPTCFNQVCDHVDGKCGQCASGYIGEFCEKQCPETTFGDGCSENCSTICLEQKCNHETGFCLSCPSGKDGNFCELVGQPQREPGGGGGADGAVIGAAVGAVIAVIVIVAIVAVFLWRRRGARKDHLQPVYKRELEVAPTAPKPEPRKTTPSVVEPVRAGDVEAPDDVSVAENPDAVYGNVLVGNTAVPVAELRSYLHQHATDTFLKDQFASIPMSGSYSQNEGLLKPNVKKNRYKNIVPYDASRVLLQADEARPHADYINASYVKGYKDDDEKFIASQGPNDLILDDFVRMLWEQRVDRVVMLTNLVELGKKKCTRYWPQDTEDTFNDITITLLTTRVYSDYTIRHLRLSKEGESPLELTQFHFTAWPDKSVPDSPWDLVDFHQRVMAAPGHGKLLVHCSAGVGRTGTFIALCHLLQEAELTGKMDFLATLWRLRQDRMSMIQTSDQYVFLHRAALVGHMAKGTTIQVKEISDRLKVLNGDSPAGVGQTYQQQYDALMEVCTDDITETEPSTSSDNQENVYQNSKTATNKQKNRLSNILPKTAYRPVFTSNNKDQDTYINAVLVPNLTKDNHDLLTQLPLPSTVTDFWRLVTQYHVGLIVAFQIEEKERDETIGEFLPKNEAEPLRDAMFEVTASTKEDTSLWQELSVTVNKINTPEADGSTEQHHMTCLLCKTTSSEPETVLDLLRKVKSLRPGEKSRTVYMCRNGADHCGLACVQSILLDKLEVDQCLAVPLVVGAIKAIRPQVIPSLDQYKCLYQVLNLQHESFNVYGNV